MSVDISTELAAILAAIYGEEVRGSIHDALLKMNNNLNTAIGNQLLTIDDTLTATDPHAAADSKKVGDIIQTISGMVSFNYNPNSSYDVGDYCSYGNSPTTVGRIYRCTTAIGSGGEVWNPDHWQRIDFADRIGEIIQYLFNKIATIYDPTRAYAVGDFCTHGNNKSDPGRIYRCNTAIGSGGEAWNASHWTLIDLADEISELNSALDEETDILTHDDILLGLLTDKSETVNGITYSLSGNAMTMSGTTSANSPSIWLNLLSIPDSINGKNVAIKVSVSGTYTLASNSGLFGIRYRAGSSSYTHLLAVRKPGIYFVQIPQNATALQFRTMLMNPSTVACTVTVEMKPVIDFETEYYANRGEIETGTTALSTLQMQGTYFVPWSKISTLTDLPSGYEANRNAILRCYPTTDSLLIQMLYQYSIGNLWTRLINTNTSEVGAWSSITSTKYLSHVENGDANNIAWTGWYGWGSTETVSNVPTGSVAGILLNVVRLEKTKYQLAFDYVNGEVYTRNSKNSVWTTWKRLAFASEIPTENKKINILHESGSFADGVATERLHIYVPAEDGYILYLMYHFVDASNNCNCWQIYNAYQVDDSFDYANRKALTVTGEWECAIHLDGRDDFSGGHTHGDEIMQNVVFLMDGVPVTISDFTELTPCTELRIIRTSTMYDPADHTTAIADHGVEYTYSKDGVAIDQSLKWLVVESLTSCFLCMFLPSKTYIDRAAANSDFDMLTLPSETGTPLTTITKPKSTGVTMWDTSSGMFADVAVPVYPTGLTGGDKMTIHDNSNKNYNKVYFYICAGGTSTVGELWKSKSIYKIGYKSAT